MHKSFFTGISMKFILGLWLLAVLFSGCIFQEPKQKEILILATTTSTYDSGLLDYLLPKFEEKYSAQVKVLSVGSGQAIEIGKRGDADAVLVHSPADEKKFVEEGFGVKRNCVMYNDFVVAGPKGDPAGVKGDDAKTAFIKIASAQALFISRGDGSGTHKKELSIWQNLSRGSWYIETGRGMGDSLVIASEKQAYILSDRGTFASMKDRVDLEIVVEGDKMLLNPYGVIAVNPDKNPKVNNAAAVKFIDWLMSEEAQALIADFRKNNEQLFKPLYGRCIE